MVMMFVCNCDLSIVLLGLFNLGIIYEKDIFIEYQSSFLKEKNILIILTYQFFVASDT